MAKTKKFYIEQVEEDDQTKKEEPLKEQSDNGSLPEEIDASKTTDVAKTVSAAEPTEPLEKAKALTEEAGTDAPDALAQILSALNDIKAEIASMKSEKATEVKTESEQSVPTEEKPVEEPVKEKESLPEEDEEEKKQEILKEKINRRRTLVDSRIRESKQNGLNVFKESLIRYARGIKEESA